VTQEVAMQARRRPDAPAVRWDSGGLSYAELVARADALAAALCAGGVRSADVVAVHGARCAGTVVAMLGVLRAGGVLLTVDPALPAARRETLVREAAARWAVAVGAAPPAAEGWWRLDARTGGLQGGRSRGAIPPHPQPDAPAYVFFTSGSTGAPKAVLGTHKGLAHFLAWQRREFGVGAGDRCAQLSALSFDAVLRDVLLPLSAGGAVCLPAEALGGGDRVVEWLRAAGVTVAHVVPSVAASWLASVPRGAALPDLRLLFFTGEPLPGPLVRRWRRMLDDGAAVVNLYGPTETTLVKCFHRVPDPPAPGTQPVGVPIADTQALVLSPEGRRCGVGERGEIVLRTPFRGLGYANDPAATRRRFVPNPFRDDPADLLYRTGDVGRYRPDGLLEVLGRLDDQVKIHGVRIEPAEVTRQLNEAPGLIAGTVVAMAEGGVPRLVAYAVMGSNSEKDEGLLRDFLRERLPAVMVPKAFVFLDRLPMLPNGKVDRRALPPPAARDCAHDPGERLTPMEAYVAALWQELLDVPRVSRNDNFFALGGHSLLAAQMTARLRADLAVELDLGAVFTAPTPATLARRLTLARRGADAEPIDGPVSGVGDAGPFPLSLAQQRVWFVDQLAPDSAAYNIRFAYRLRGPVDHRALERGLADLVRRHEALRVRVTVDDGQPAQEFVPANLAPLVVEHQDLAGVATQDRSARLHAVLGDFAARPFDLRSPPLLRAALIVLDREECVLALVIHHLAADGWSTGLLIRELAELYGAHRAQRTPDLSSAPRYSDFVAWQRRSLASNDRAEAAIGYWRRRLDGLAVTEIAADRPRPARMSFCGGRVEGRVPRDTALGLYALARRTGATPFVVLLAAFKTLLWRYTGQPDVCVGTPEASRARQELERLVGLCTNTLILRTGLDASQPFTDAVARVRATVFEAVEHADAPFEKIVEALNPDRDPARNPLFQVLFQLQHGPLRPAMALPGVEVEPVLVDNGSTKRDLSVFVQEQGDELRIVVEYDAELFDATTALRLIGHYKVLLGSVAQDPDRALTALPVMDPGERHRLTAQWSGAGVSGAAEACVHREFEAVARAAPQTVAVVYADRRLSYAELDARAERLARYLRARGTETETRIGLCMERSPDAIVAILAVLKAGGAYVPLDPDQPADRLLAMIDSAGLRMVLASMDTGMRLRDAPVDVIVIERGGPPCSGGPVQAPAALVAPANLAYVLFTSGSTGAPKAVAVEHRQVVSYCRAVAPRLGLTQGEHHAMVQPLSVDSSVTSLWGALLTGGTLHLVPREQSLDARALAQYLEGTPIDVLKIAPSHLRSLHAAAPDCLLMPRRCLVLGGEELPRAWADALAARSAGACSAFNHYGPTETTVGVMTNPSDAGSDVSAGRNVPLGRPLAGSRVYVLDRFLEPVPIGVPGEIHVAGAQVARGYLDAVRTADRFVPDPFTSHPGERMYRTGDLGRWRADGTVEFLGRMDAEVKIRGFRVDPAEVEALLRAHPQVGSAVVVARPDQAGQTRLVAYVARQAEGARDRHADLGESVHAHLAARLPQYMLPSVVVLERMPLTPQGKLDRNRLPAAPVRHGRGPRTAPRNAVEASLKSIWEELLDVAQVGIDEDFFGLGGHSLLCARLIARINQRFGASIGIRAIFEARTIAAQAALLRPAGEARHGGAAERAQADGGPSPLSFGQLRMWFLDQLAPGLASYNIGVVLRLRGRVNVEALSAALQEIVRRHEVLRTTFHLVDDEPAQIVTPAEAATMELERLHVAGEDAAMAAASDFVHRPFDLRRDLMLRAMLVRQGEAKHLVCAALHHIASDGWSRRVFYRELGTLYAAFDAGRASPLPPLPLQYRDYARWQRAMGREEEASRQLVHWRRALADLPTLDLPTDRPRPALQSHDGARVDFELPPALCAAIEALAREEKATPFMALMAAYQAVLGRRSGQRDFAVGAPVANRSRPEHESLIGFFVNTLALRADLRGRPAFRELLGRVRDTTMNAFEHQDVPFERIVAELAPLRQLGRPPLAQVLLTVQNFPRVDIALPDCRVEVAYARTRTVTFELNLVLYGHERALNGALLYNATLFDRDTAQALVRDFRGLLEAAAARPDVPVDALWPALDVRARERTPGPGQAGGTASAPPRCPMELLAEQARRRPDVEALDDGVRALTYREVWERTNRLGHYLRRRGVGPEVAVGVHLQRGADLPLTMIAVLKAGGVCVPLDPELPPGRLAQMVNVSGLRVIVTDARDGSGWATGCRVLINLGAAQRDIAREPAGRPADTVVDDNLAYVLFTSGTTGEPKGVAMPRRGLANLVGWQISTARKPAARTFQFASAGFDVFFQEVLATLCAGGTLVIPREPARGDFGAMAALIEEQGVERLYVPFVALCRLAETAGARGRSMPALIEVITAGEQAHATGPLREWFGMLHGCRLVNQYGPTETHVVTAFELDPLPVRWPARPPIGRAVAGARVHLLDAGARPVPAGAVGEIYLGGAGLARAYANRPGLTAEHFVPDALSGEPGARLYRTGDRARIGRDGQLEFLGRLDAQVKIRGIRVEPGEIECAVMSHPDVSGCVVVPRQGVPSEPLLVAYVVATRNVSEPGLRAYLSRRLPEVMVPERLVFLPRLPLGANGKVNTGALPEPAIPRGSAQASVAAPASEMERRLMAIWEDVLGAQAIGADDDFFDHGGHSLKAARLVANVRRVLGVDVPLRWLFECRTPRRLAERLAAEAGAPDRDGTPGAESVREAGPAAPRRQVRRGTIPAIHRAAGTGCVARVWCEVLGCGEARPDDDFFDLGGHSLAAVRLANRVASELGVEVPVRLLFEHPGFERFEREVAALVRGVNPSLVAPGLSAAGEASPDALAFESTPLLALVIGGRLPPVDAAALGYFADASIPHCRGGRDGFLRAWCDGLPTVSAITNTPLGRTAIIRVPWLAGALYDDRGALVASVVEAVRLAGAIGARVVSLTGLIPSATDYGRAVVAALPADEGLPAVTTGHATTASSVVLALRRTLREAGRCMDNEHVGFLGLGSIGTASLRLMLERLPQPAALTLCDVYSRRSALEQIAASVRRDCGYRGTLDLVEASPDVPEAFYEAGVVVGATNVPDVLDVARLRPGSLIVDDSGPHCFVPDAAIERFERRGDILFTEGGMLCAPRVLPQVRHLPAAVESIMTSDYLASLRRHEPRSITGCVVSALLGARHPELGVDIGEVAPAAAAAHFDRLLSLGFDAAPLRCGAYTLESDGVARFRQRFSRADRGRDAAPEALGE
jgi:amino acid adenylation domain-containing protein